MITKFARIIRRLSKMILWLKLHFGFCSSWRDYTLFKVWFELEVFTLRQFHYGYLLFKHVPNGTLLIK